MCPCYPNSPKYQLPGCLLFQFLFVSYSDSSKYQLPRPLFLTSSNLCDICDSSFFQLLRFPRIPVTRALSYCFLSCTLWWVELDSDELSCTPMRYRSLFLIFFLVNYPNSPKYKLPGHRKIIILPKLPKLPVTTPFFFTKCYGTYRFGRFELKSLP